MGNMAVQNSLSTLKDYYWEIYQIMGDPSLVPSKYNMPKLSANYDKVLKIGQDSIIVNTIKNAVVSLMYEEVVLDVNIADNNGLCKLKFTPLESVGEKCLELVVSQNSYTTLIDSLDIVAPDEAYLVYRDFIVNREKPQAGDTLLVDLRIENLGNQTAKDIEVVFNSNSVWLTKQVSDYKVNIDSIEADVIYETKNHLQLIVSDTTPNDSVITVVGVIKYNEKSYSDFSFNITINSPHMTVVNWNIDKAGVGNLDGIIDADEEVTVSFDVSNIGNIQVSNTTINVVSSDNNLLSVLTTTQNMGGFDADEIKSVDIDVKSAKDVFPGIHVHLKYTITAGENNQLIYTGEIPVILGVEPKYSMSNSTVSIVSGYFYDSGGLNERYSVQESYVMTFIPYFSNQGLMIDFSAFELESSNTNNCYDKFSVYDGVDTNSPLIGDYCGSDIKDIIQSQNRDGALTFKFVSDNTVTKNGWEAYITSSNRYKVTIDITNGTDGIDSAIVVLGNSADTSINGKVIFENILGKDIKYYSINKDGYLPIESTIGDISSDTTITVLMKKIPDICFAVSEGTNPIDSVRIVFDGKELFTNDKGYANFINISSGIKKFYAYANRYIDTAGIIVVKDVDACYNLNLRREPTYKLTFVVSDNNGLVENASVSIDNRKKLTNINGEVVVDGLYSGYYGYTICKNGYDTISNNITIDNGDITKQISLTKQMSVILISEEKLYKVYPNPLSKNLDLNILSDKIVSGIKLIDYSGRVVYENNTLADKLKINTSELNIGIYILQLTIDGKVYFEKIIIK
jgi:hypothetical protein